MRTIWKPARHHAALGGTHLAPRAPSDFFFRPRHPAPDFIIPKVTQLPEILHQCGWRPVHAAAPHVAPLKIVLPLSA